MKNQTTLRVYVDTSVIGGCFDSGFAEDSRRLFTLARRGELVLVISQVVIDEVAKAPVPVREVLPSLPSSAVEYILLSDAIIALRDAYMDAGIIGRKWLDDATHVAAASVAGVDAIASWNFKHMVRLDKIHAYNRINQKHGYGIMTIVTPRQVDSNEED